MFAVFSAVSAFGFSAFLALYTPPDNKTLQGKGTSGGGGGGVPTV